MGRKGGVAGLLGKAAGKAGDKASKRRKKMGPGSFLRGGSPGNDFLASFAQRRAQQQEQARAAVTDRVRAGAGGGSPVGGLLARLFGQGR